MDQATVRVLAMGAPELVTIEEDGTDYHIAVPVAGHGSGVLVTDNGLILRPPTSSRVHERSVSTSRA